MEPAGSRWARAVGPAGSRCALALCRWVPALQWAPRYDRTTAVGDLVAGVTLGLTLVPQSIAYAGLANLPVAVGLYSALAGGLVYALAGTVPQVSMGPTSLMALLTLQACDRLPPPYVPLLAFLSGLAVLLMGLLRLGFLVDLISPATTAGFTTGTALIVAIAQVKGLLGLSFVAESVPENVVQVFKLWRKIRLGDCLLSAGCCLVLLALRKLKDVQLGPKRFVLQKALWLLSIGRNALVVTAAASIAYYYRDRQDPKDPWFKLSGRVQPGLPSLVWPAPLHLPAPHGNGTVTLIEAAQHFGAKLIFTPLVMVLANIAIAKAFSPGRVDAQQEMVALGLSNALGAALQAMPVCGAFTRSAVSHASGVRTPAAGLYSGAITMLALVFLTEYFYYIPRASLSSVLICAVIFMVDISYPRALWRRGERLEALVWLATLGTSLTIGVEAALAAGAAISMGLLLWGLAATRGTPQLHKSPLGPVLVVSAPTALVYLTAGGWAERAAAAVGGDTALLLVDCGGLAILDDAATQELEQLHKKLSGRGTRLAAFNARDSVAERLGRLRWLPPACLTATELGGALRALGSHPAPPRPAPQPTLEMGPDCVPLLTINVNHDH